MSSLSVKSILPVLLLLCSGFACGQEFYGIAYNRKLYRYDALSGDAEVIQTVAAAPNSLTSWKNFVYVGYDRSVVELSPPLWTPQPVFSFTPPVQFESIRCLAAHPVSGDIYFASTTSETIPLLWRWNRETGLVERKGTIDPLVNLQGMEFDRTGTLYGWESSLLTTTGRGLVRVDTDTALATDVFPESNAPGFGATNFVMQSLAFDSAGVCYLASQQYIYRLSGPGDNLTTVRYYQNEIGSDFRGIVMVPSSFGTWQNTAFPPNASAAQVAAAADYDGDGLQNFMEYALGSDPVVPGAPPAPFLLKVDDLSFLSLRWNRPAGRDDVRVNGEVCDSLDCQFWKGSPTDTLTQYLTEPDGSETVIVSDLVPFGTGGPRRFLRARFGR